MNQQIFKVQKAKMVGDPSLLYVIFVQPVIFSLLFGYLHRAGSGGSSESFSIFIGVGLMTLWQVLLYAGGIIVRHEFNRERTIYYSLLSMTSLYWIWAKRLIFCLLLATPGFLLALLVGVFIFGATAPINSFIYLFIGLLLFFITLYSIGLPIILLLFLTIHGGKIIQTATYPIYLLSGMIVSVDHFPAFIKDIAFLFPITWSVHWIQDVVDVNNIDWSAFVLTILISLFYLVFSRLIFVYIMKKIRIKGEINL
jgi:ABC-2 type transport system permease protein